MDKYTTDKTTTHTEWEGYNFIQDKTEKYGIQGSRLINGNFGIKQNTTVIYTSNRNLWTIE